MIKKHKFTISHPTIQLGLPFADGYHNISVNLLKIIGFSPINLAKQLSRTSDKVANYRDRYRTLFIKIENLNQNLIRSEPNQDL